MYLCADRGRFLFEARPDLFGDYCGDVEMELWSLYYSERAAERKKHG